MGLFRDLGVAASLAVSPGMVAAAEPVDFDLNVVIMTPKFQGESGQKGADGRQRRDAAVRERFQSHVERLNEEFRSEAGEPLVRFHLKAVTLWREIKDSPCEAVALARRSENFAPALKACDDARVRRPRAVNVYVYSPWISEEDKKITSHGRVGSFGPYTMIHWRNHHDFETFWHEIGHAFGLPHVCSSPRPEGTHWNIMATPDTCKTAKTITHGFHFDEKQTAKVKEHIARYQQMFTTQ
ncbi:hypothetical protein EG831_03020 [bacterium]|nr:hypothetical protein [bacterium]